MLRYGCSGAAGGCAAPQPKVGHRQPGTLPTAHRHLRRQAPGRLHVLRRDVPPADARFDTWLRLSDAALGQLARPGLALVPAAAALLLLSGDPSLGPRLSHGGAPSASGQHQVEVDTRPPPQEPQPRVLTGNVTRLPSAAAPAHAGHRVQRAGGNERPFELDATTASALLVSMAVAALANSAGVGGGAFIVPLMYLGLGFDIKDSTALSQAVIAGGALGSVACTVAQQHPQDSRRPLIDYRLALIITPPLLLGCTSGVLFNQLLPSWGVTFLLIPLLGYLTYRTACTAARLHRAEAVLATLDRLLTPEEDAGLETAHRRLQAEAEDERRRLAQPEPPEGCPSPWQHGLQLLVLWGVVLGFQLGKLSFDRCSWQFAALYGGQATATLAASAFFIWQTLHERQQGGGCCGAVPLAGAQLEGVAPAPDVAAGDSSTWAAKRLVSSAGVALAGGSVAGMLGIGGGMIVGPLMMELGIHPQVASATASAMVLFSASSAAASFALEGRLNTAYALPFGLSCALAAYVGVELVGRAVRSSGKSSLVVMLLAGIIGAGALLTTLFSGGDAVAELLAGQAPGMGSFCAVAG